MDAGSAGRGGCGRRGRVRLRGAQPGAGPKRGRHLTFLDGLRRARATVHIHNSPVPGEDGLSAIRSPVSPVCLLHLTGPGASGAAELLCQGSGFSGRSRGRIDKGAGGRRDFRPAVPSAVFPGRLPATSSTSLVGDAAPGRKATGQWPGERELLDYCYGISVTSVFSIS